MARIKLDLTQILLDYIKVPKTSYCIMIKGDWGCGKTCFIDNIFADKLKRQKIPSKNGKNYEIVRISLFGVKSKDEITERLLSAQMPLYNKIKPFLGLVSFGAKATIRANRNPVEAAISSTLNTSEIVKQSKEWFNDDNHVIYIFDDFERIDSSFSPDEIFSYISQMVEKENKKVIIVCNEEKSRNVKRGEYKEIKEKVVRYTYEYSSDLEDVYDSICSKVAQDGDYLSQIKTKKYKEIILQIFKSANHNNLRTLEFIIDVYEKIWMNRPKGSENFEEEYIQKTLTTVTILSIENKMGVSDHKTIYNALGVIDFADLDIDLDNNSFNEEDVVDDTEKSDNNRLKEQNRIKKYYSNFNRSFLSNKLWYDYVNIGYINEKELEREVEAITGQLKKEQDTPEGKEYKRFMSPCNYSDQENTERFNHVWGFLKEHKYDFDQINRIIQMSYSLNTDVGYNLFIRDVDYQDALDQAITSDNYKNVLRNLDFVYANRKEEVRTFADYVKKRCDELACNEITEETQKLELKISQNDIESIKTILDANPSVLTHIPEEKMASLIATAGNATVNVLFTTFKKIIASYGTNGYNFKMFCSHLEIVQKETTDKMKIFNIKNMIEKLQKAN